MSVTSSGLFVATMSAFLTDTAGFSLGAEDHRVAMFTNDITPDFAAVAADARYGAGAFLLANEVTGTGYTAGGKLLLNTALAGTPGPGIAWTADDPEWPNSTIVEARCALVYADAVTTPNADPAIMLIDFGNDYSTNNGTFSIVFTDGVLFEWTVVPVP